MVGSKFFEVTKKGNRWVLFWQFVLSTYSTHHQITKLHVILTIYIIKSPNFTKFLTTQYNLLTVTNRKRRFSLTKSLLTLVVK